MKILNRQRFLTMPVGTVYHKFDPNCFDGLCVKGDSIEDIDWFYADFIGAIDANDSGHFGDLCDAMAERGASVPCDFQSYGRDGLFDKGQMFAVLEPDDVRKLIAALQKTLPQVKP